MNHVNLTVPITVPPDESYVFDPTQRPLGATPDLNTRLGFVNNTSYSITIIDRQNVEYVLPPTSNSAELDNSIVVYKQVSFSNSVKINTNTERYEGENKSSQQVMEHLTKASATRGVNTPLSHSYNLRTAVNVQTLIRNKGALYLSEFDVVIVQSELAFHTVHPYSNVGQLMLSDGVDNLGGFYYRVLINDPDREFSDRYINFNGQVFRVRRIADRNMAPGVHVQTSEDSLLEDSRLFNTATKHYSLDEADKQKLFYASMQDAIDYGDTNKRLAERHELAKLELKHDDSLLQNQLLAAKREQSQTDKELLELKAKVERDKQQHELQINKLKSANDEAKQIRDEMVEAHKAEIERERLRREEDIRRIKDTYEVRAIERKDRYEERSYTRKDTNDGLKMAAAITGAIVSVIGTVFGLIKLFS